MKKQINEEELKNKIEAILFAMGDKIPIDDIRKLVRVRDIEIVEKAINELKEDFEKREGPLRIINEGSFWKITVRDKYLDIIRRIVPKTDLPKTVIETLSLIAWKNPAKQSDVVAMRTNKAYSHINYLLDAGFITRVKKGRTYLLKLTERFFDYFDVEGSKNIREMFEQLRTNMKQRKKKNSLDSTVNVKIPISGNEIHLE